MSYVVTEPRKGPRVLHQARCKELHGRAKRHALISGNAYSLETLRGVQQCDLCITRVRFDHYAAARAEAWMGHLTAAHKEIVANRESYERHMRIQNAKEAWRGQFESLRSACEIAWGYPVEFIDYTWNGNLTLRLGNDRFGDVGSIFLQATDGYHKVEYVGMNNSTAIINGPRDAHALSAIFTLIDHWTSAEPVEVPADAPNFWRAA